MSAADAEIRAALAAPFPPDEIGWKPQSVKGNRALAIAYIDARNVMDRLDQVVGVDNWQDRFEVLPDHSVLCRLSVRFGDKWISKADVGSPSEQPDGGDRLKAAFSDALKRTAVKFGIGRYLYNLPHQWCDYDPVKKHFVNRPILPDWAIPSKQVAKPAEPAPKPAETPKADPQPHPAILRNEFARLIREVAKARALEPDAVFERTRAVGMERYHDLGRTTSDWTREQIDWGIDSLKKTLAKSQPAQREPGQDDDGVGEPKHLAKA